MIKLWEINLNDKNLKSEFIPAGTFHELIWYLSWSLLQDEVLEL